MKRFDWVHRNDVERAFSLFVEVLAGPGIHAPIEFSVSHAGAPGATSSVPSTTCSTIRASGESWSALGTSPGARSSRSN
jgi:hypothetical protein